ncbi:MAG TPA: glucose-6-phosphate dehydrogenase [Candidatus Acidoferrum sp.]|nr:glucose-6-phosphate dehydrogenase [Candidatus Acidoferrum sp.]
MSRTSDPCVFVVFGAAGDLTSRLLLPAIGNLREAGLLPDGFAVIGVARNHMSDGEFQTELSSALDKFNHGGVSTSVRQWFGERVQYVRGDFGDAQLYSDLQKRIVEVQGKCNTGTNALFYLATPPAQFAPIVRQLGTAKLVHETNGGWRRVVIEKPFGRDLRSAQALNHEILTVLSEHQIYRIDHYLGKETVQNIMALRFANGIFEPLWNRNHIDHVQITVAEAIGVEHRGRFYDATGALRDMVPSHIFQLLSLIAMEPPTCFDADHVRSEKAKVLNAVHLGRQEAGTDVVRAQYTAGVVDDRSLKAYRQSPDVARESATETYVAMKLRIANWRWTGVPFYLRTGKALAKRRTEILIRFKRAPIALFRDVADAELAPNDLLLHIQPEEGVSLRFSAKVPGQKFRLGDVHMAFKYADYFKIEPRTGYETLLYDCMIGDATQFQRADNIEAGWKVVQPILDVWAGGPDTLAAYAAGSTGPIEADALMERDGRRWRSLDSNDGP